MTDAELINHYRNGDETAFDTLYAKYRKPLFAYLNGLLPGQPALVDDLYQQTWIRIVGSLPRYRHREKFLAWSFRIAHNLAMDHFRRQEPADLQPADQDLACSREEDPATDLQQRELQQAVEDAIQQLPPNQREIVLLRRQGLPFKDIARIQGTKLNTVLGRMHYAVAKLRRDLSAWAED